MTVVHVCDRCGGLFRTAQMGAPVCRPCFLGGLPPVERVLALIGGPQ